MKHPVNTGVRTLYCNDDLHKNVYINSVAMATIRVRKGLYMKMGFLFIQFAIFGMKNNTFIMDKSFMNNYLYNRVI